METRRGALVQTTGQELDSPNLITHHLPMWLRRAGMDPPSEVLACILSIHISEHFSPWLSPQTAIDFIFSLPSRSQNVPATVSHWVTLHSGDEEIKMEAARWLMSCSCPNSHFPYVWFGWQGHSSLKPSDV